MTITDGIVDIPCRRIWCSEGQETCNNSARGLCIICLEAFCGYHLLEHVCEG